MNNATVTWSTTAVSGLNLVKNGNVVTINASDDMPEGTYNLVALYGEYSKLLNIIIKNHEHTPSDWIIDTPATETTTGSKHKECTECKTILETEEIPIIQQLEAGLYDVNDNLIMTWNEVINSTELSVMADGTLTSDNGAGNINSVRTNLQSLTGKLILPNIITSINASTFKNCSGLTSIIIPNSVTSIGGYAFYGCTKLTSITIPDGVTSIGNLAFYSCQNLTTITIPDSVTSIGDSAFNYCIKLKSIIIPNTVTSIGNRAFESCSNLTSITIPNGVTSIGDFVFFQCKNLASITIPDSVTSIGQFSFHNCENLTSITIPDGVTSIGQYSFNSCERLTSITIPNNVTTIGNYAFYNVPHIYYNGTATGKPWGAKAIN